MTDNTHDNDGLPYSPCEMRANAAAREIANALDWDAAWWGIAQIIARHFADTWYKQECAKLAKQAQLGRDLADMVLAAYERAASGEPPTNEQWWEPVNTARALLSVGKGERE